MAGDGGDLRIGAFIFHKHGNRSATQVMEMQMGEASTELIPGA
jgi:hypothetical protein